MLLGAEAVGFLQVPLVNQAGHAGGPLHSKSPTADAEGYQNSALSMRVNEMGLLVRGQPLVPACIRHSVRMASWTCSEQAQSRVFQAMPA